MNRSQFHTLLVICFASALFVSIIMAIRNYQDNTFNNFNKTLSNSKNDLVNKTTILVNVINWKGQGTIQWGATFLSTVTVFFTLIFFLYSKKVNANKDKILPIERILCFMTWVFFLAGTVSVFNIFYYYRLVNSLLNEYFRLVNIPEGFPSPLLSDFFMYFWGDIFMIIFTGSLFVYFGCHRPHNSQIEEPQLRR